MKSIFFKLAFCLIASYSFTAQAMESISLSSYPPLRWEKQVNGLMWTQHVFGEIPEIGENLRQTNPADMSRWCANYSQLSPADRTYVWAYILSAMAQHESGFNAHATYSEAFEDKNGDAVISRGLLQISFESGRAYGCPLVTPQDLHNPYTNLSCGIRILSRWVKTDKQVGAKINGKNLGGARYWSIFRKSTRLNQMRKWVSQLDVCKRP